MSIKLLEEFIDRSDKLRAAAHRAHWSADSGYIHETLGDFYDGLPGQVDRLVEPYIAAFREKPKAPENIAEDIRIEMLWLVENREKLAQQIPALKNIIDEVSKFYLDVLYKIENLR